MFTIVSRLVRMCEGIVYRLERVNIVLAEKVLDEQVLPFSRDKLRRGVTMHELITQLRKGGRDRVFLERYRQLSFVSRMWPIGLTWT
jgi:hypothetical protein